MVKRVLGAPGLSRTNFLIRCFCCTLVSTKLSSTHKSTHNFVRGGGSIPISLVKPGIVHIFYKSQEGTNGVEDEARFCLVDDLIVVS